MEQQRFINYAIICGIVVFFLMLQIFDKRVVVILIVVGITVYIGFNKYTVSKTTEDSRTKEIEDILNDSPCFSEKKHILKLILSDQQLMDPLLKLQKYKNIDIQNYVSIIEGMVLFLDMYIVIMSDKENLKYNLLTLIETRRSLLNNIVNYPDKSIKDDVQKTTLRYLKVLKLKYDLTEYIDTPLPHNMTNSFDIF